MTHSLNYLQEMRPRQAYTLRRGNDHLLFTQACCDVDILNIDLIFTKFFSKAVNFKDSLSCLITAFR